MKTLVFAEAASAHDGDWQKACALVDVAAECGADVVKVQYFHDPDLMADRRRVPDYYRAVYHKYSVPLDWLSRLADRAHARGIKFACSAFVPGAFKLIAPDCDYLKISSFEAMDEELREEAVDGGGPVIVSVGMCGVGEIGDLVRWRQRTCWDTDEPYQASLLHCVSAYPCKAKDCNLGAIGGYDLDGFSDHTALVDTGHDAVLAGARIIESHIRLDDTDPDNPDYRPALGPAEYRRYVQRIREAEIKLGSGVKVCGEAEREMARYRYMSNME